MENFEDYRGVPKQERPIISHEEEMLFQVHGVLETALKIKALFAGEMVFGHFLAELGVDELRDKTFHLFTHSNGSEQEQEKTESNEFEIQKDKEIKIIDLRRRSTKLFQDTYREF